MRLSIETPMTPNFLRVRIGDESTLVPIADATDEQLREVGRQWTEKLVEIAQRRRNEALKAAGR